MAYRLRHYRGGSAPPLFVVHHAVKIAAAHCNSSFESVMKPTPRQRGLSTHDVRLANRARIYAALALRALYLEQCDDDLIARMLFANAPATWFYQLDARMRRGELRGWWRDAIFMKVIEGVEKLIEVAKARHQQQQAAE